MQETCGGSWGLPGKRRGWKGRERFLECTEEQEIPGMEQARARYRRGWRCSRARCGVTGGRKEGGVLTTRDGEVLGSPEQGRRMWSNV